MRRVDRSEFYFFTAFSTPWLSLLFCCFFFYCHQFSECLILKSVYSFLPWNAGGILSVSLALPRWGCPRESLSLPAHHWVSFCVWLPVGLNIIKRTKQRPSNKLTGSFHCIRAVWQWVGLKHHFSCALAKMPIHLTHYSSWAYSYTDTLLAVQESHLWSHYLPACTPLYLNKPDWLKSSFASSLQQQNIGVT